MLDSGLFSGKWFACNLSLQPLALPVGTSVQQTRHQTNQRNSIHRTASSLEQRQDLGLSGWPDTGVGRSFLYFSSPTHSLGSVFWLEPGDTHLWLLGSTYCCRYLWHRCRKSYRSGHKPVSSSGQCNRRCCADCRVISNINGLAVLSDLARNRHGHGWMSI